MLNLNIFFICLKFGRISKDVRTVIQPCKCCSGGYSTERTMSGRLSKVVRALLFWFGHISNRANAFCADSEKMSKRSRANSQADDKQSSARTLTVEQHTEIIMSRSIVVERDIKLADFNNLTFEGRTLPEVVEGLGWLSLIHRTGYASNNMVREFYCSILRARDLEEASMELTVRNVSIIFSPDELANFLGYERDLTAFPNLSMSEEGRPTTNDIFRTVLGDDTTILEGSFMVHGQLRPFWWIMHLILCPSIDPKKYTIELSYSRAEFLYLAIVRGLPVDIASYIHLSIRAEALKIDATISLPHEILLTQFLHVMMVPESGDEPRALPLGVNQQDHALQIDCSDTSSTASRSGC